MASRTLPDLVRKAEALKIDPDRLGSV